MKTIYLDLSMGAAGDMLCAALYELLGSSEEKASYVTVMNALGLDGVEVTPEKVVKLGVTGTHMTVKVDGVSEGAHHDHGHHDHAGEHHDHGNEHHDHNHSSLKDIEAIVAAMPVSDKVKKDVMSIYTLLAKAERMAPSFR